MVVKKKIIITGSKVHDTGYRPYLLGIAESMELDRFFADNAIVGNKQVVNVLIDTSQDKAGAFIEIASTKFPEKSKVEKVEVEDYTGNVMKTESYYRYLTAMQLSKIATYGGIMLEKQDETITEIKVSSENIITEVKGSSENIIRGVKGSSENIITEVKNLSVGVDQGREEIVTELRSLRNDFKSHFDERLTRLEMEVSQIKAKVCV